MAIKKEQLANSLQNDNIQKQNEPSLTDTIVLLNATPIYLSVRASDQYILLSIISTDKPFGHPKFVSTMAIGCTPSIVALLMLGLAPQSVQYMRWSQGLKAIARGSSRLSWTSTSFVLFKSFFILLTVFSWPSVQYNCFPIQSYAIPSGVLSPEMSNKQTNIQIVSFTLNYGNC